MKNKKNKILITGGAGYIGSLLIEKLLKKGFEIICLDIFIYGDSAIKQFYSNKNFQSVKGDIRDKKLLKRILIDVKTIIHLAAIVGDKPCQIIPKQSTDINVNGTKILAQLAKKNKVEKLIYASTCSNYGIIKMHQIANEKTKLNPVSLYAKQKIKTENLLKKISSKKFKIISFRFGTAFGISHRTRFDLTVNSLAFEAIRYKKIEVYAKSTYRPYIHVRDIAAILKVAVIKNFSNNFYIFNGGFTSQNYTKEQLVNILKKVKQNIKMEYVENDDRRSYKVNFKKLENFFNLKPSMSVKKGFQEMISAIKFGEINDKIFYSNNLKGLIRYYKKNKKKLVYEK